METLEYITSRKVDDGFNVHVQLSGRGAGFHVKKGADSSEVLCRLQELFENIKKGIDHRETG